MSHFINPLYVEGCIDDQIGKSVQGCYQGTLDAPQERMLDKKLKAEYKRRAEIIHEKMWAVKNVHDIVEQIVRMKKRHAKEEKIQEKRLKAVAILEKIEELDKML